MSLEMHFENCGSLCAHLLGLIVSLYIYVELGKEGLDITLVLGGHNISIEVLIEGHLLVSVSLDWCISASYTA